MLYEPNASAMFLITQVRTELGKPLTYNAGFCYLGPRKSNNVPAMQNLRTANMCYCNKTGHKF
jgi:hypothetical protein